MYYCTEYHWQLQRIVFCCYNGGDVLGNRSFSALLQSQGTTEVYVVRWSVVIQYTSLGSVDLALRRAVRGEVDRCHPGCVRAGSKQIWIL